ncbi:MAG: hypothetical protein Kow0099_34540 [Candidatus Abyssubacteria bacterium]
MSTWLRNERLIPPALLVILVFSLFHDVANHSFNSDDYLVVYHGLYRTPETLKEALAGFTEPTWGLYYRPLIKAFFELLAGLFGIWPGGYHMASLLFYAVLCLEVYLLALLLCGRVSAAVFSALIFMTASAHSEALFWVSSLNGVVENIFTLAALICFVQWRRTASGIYHLLSLILFVLAVFTKESAIVLPIVFAAYEVLIGNRPMSGQAFRQAVKSCWTFALVAVLFALIRAMVMSQVDLPPPLASFGLRTLLAGMCYSLIMTLSPLDWALSLHWFDKFTEKSGAFVLVSMALLLACIIGPLVAKRFRLAFLLAWILAGSAPVLVLGLVPSERHVVFGSAGAAILLAIAISKLGERLGKTGAASGTIAMVLAVMFSAVSFYFLQQRQAIWKKASETASYVVSQTQDAFPTSPPTTFFYLNVPDTLDGALVFRFENLEYALKLAYRNDSIEVVRIVTLDRISPDALKSAESAYFKIAAMGGNVFLPKESLDDGLTRRWERLAAYGILDRNTRYFSEWARYETAPLFAYTGTGLVLMPRQHLKQILTESLYSLV